MLGSDSYCLPKKRTNTSSVKVVLFILFLLHCPFWIDYTYYGSWPIPTFWGLRLCNLVFRLCYLDLMEKRFHKEKHEWGFDEFISLKEFKGSPKGYLVDDTCVFGAEVFVKERIIQKGECLSMIKDAINYKTTWEINKFSKLGAKVCESKEFNAGDQKW